ncbi:MAG: hypothetical protein KKD92_10575 [Proteobacteria bacterium]|nr:hypothetical protein [Pseudomonadota bacterium]
MTEILNVIITASGLIFLLSFFAMASYLFRAKVYTMWQIRVNPLWPRIIFEYRDHTKRYSGKIGIWYYISGGSFFIFVFTMATANVPQLFVLPAPITIIIMAVAVFIIPAIGYAIYGLSKEKYF